MPQVSLNTVADPAQNDVNKADLSSIKAPQARTAKVASPAHTRAIKASPGMGEGTAESMDAATQAMGNKANAATQAKDIMSEKSPLMRMARQEGMLSAAKRGLGNSSIAAGNAQAAMSRAAIPLAQQNASQEQKQELANQEATNRAEQFNVGEANKMENLNVTETNRGAIYDAEAQNKLNSQFRDEQSKKNIVDATEYNKAAMQKHSTDAEVNTTWLSGEISKSMTHIQGQYQEIIGASSVAGQMFGNTMDTLAGMWANKDIPISVTNRYAASAMGFLEGGLKVQGSIMGMTFRSDMPNA